MQSQPCVYKLSGHSNILYAIACDDHKQACFQEASILMQTALQLDIATKAAVLRQDGQLDDTMRCGVSYCSTRPGILAAACWPEDLIHDLRWIDAQAGSPERLFTVATVKVGPHTGLKAVGIATNQERLKRASNLALAFAAARSMPQANIQLPELPVVTCDSVAFAVPKAIDKHVNATVVCHPDSSDNHIDMTTSAVWQMENSDKENDHPDFDKWLNGDSPVDCAKQRLVSFRQRNPCLAPALRDIIADLANDCLTKASHHSRPEIWAHVVQDLQTVLKCDTWKEESCGRHWVRLWQKWQQPFDDPSCFHFGKAAKKQANYRWHFGCDPPTDNDTSSALPCAPSTFVQNNNDGAPPPPSPGPLKSAPKPPPKAPPKASLPDPPSPGPLQPAPKPPPKAPPKAYLPYPPSPGPLQPAPKPPPKAPKAPPKASPPPPPSPPLSSIDRSSRSRWLESEDVSRPNTTRAQTPDSSESVMQFKPIVCNDDEDNSTADDDIDTLLQRSDLSCRVLDGENIGYSFGREVLHIRDVKKQYAVEGVRRAVEHFRERNIEVIVVTRHAEAKQIHGDGVQVVVSDRTDDLFVLKLSQQRKCPVVSRDGYDQWRKDPRVAADLRQWGNKAANMQVRFSWGPKGEFMPDFDLPQPVARQQRRRSNSRHRMPANLDWAQ